MSRHAKITLGLLALIVGAFVTVQLSLLVYPTTVHAQSSKKWPADYTENTAPSANDYTFQNKAADGKDYKVKNSNLPKAFTPGSDTQVLFNDGGTIGADSGMVFNKTTDVLTVGGSVGAIKVATSGTDSTPNVAIQNDARLWNIYNDGSIGDVLAIYDGTALQYRLVIDTAGRVGINKSSSIGGQLHTVAGSASTIPLVVQGAASQSVNFFDVQTSAGASVFAVDSSASVRMATNLYHKSLEDSANRFYFANNSDTYLVSPSAGGFRFQTGGVDTVLISNIGGVTVNEAGSDADTRIEGDTDANLFFVDASTDRIGVGTATPAARVDVVASATTNPIFGLTSTATNDDPNVLVMQDRVATTDATVTTIKTIAITASRTYRIHAEVIARRTGGTAGTADDGAAYTREWAFTTKTGTVTQLGADAMIFTAEDQAGWDVDATVSGTDVLIQVTGAADNNVVWHLSKCEVSYVGT